MEPASHGLLGFLIVIQGSGRDGWVTRVVRDPGASLPIRKLALFPYFNTRGCLVPFVLGWTLAPHLVRTGLQHLSFIIGKQMRRWSNSVRSGKQPRLTGQGQEERLGNTTKPEALVITQKMPLKKSHLCEEIQRPSEPELVLVAAQKPPPGSPGDDHMCGLSCSCP